VRFAEKTDARAEAGGLATAGYVIVRVPDWAAHTAWVEARSRAVADALTGIEALRRLSGVERVEPEMLGQRRRD
jgi:hypothetical protein